MPDAGPPSVYEWRVALIDECGQVEDHEGPYDSREEAADIAANCLTRGYADPPYPDVAIERRPVTQWERVDVVSASSTTERG